MIFYYIRHGDPIYDPDSLTELGKRQAEAAGKRLALHGIDKVYSSVSNRAIETAKPTCELTKNEVQLLEFANEALAWKRFNVKRNGCETWLFQDKETRNLFSDTSVISLGHSWYEHPEFVSYKESVDSVYEETTDFFKSLGYDHIRNTGKYKVIRPNNEKVAFFAHQGFGIAFLSTILDIPYPIFANHFDICHTGITVIEFREEDGFAIPKILTLSSDGHLYRDGLPTKYNNVVYI